MCWFVDGVTMWRYVHAQVPEFGWIEGTTDGARQLNTGSDGQGGAGVMSDRNGFGVLAALRQWPNVTLSSPVRGLTDRAAAARNAHAERCVSSFQ